MSVFHLCGKLPRGYEFRVHADEIDKIEQVENGHRQVKIIKRKYVGLVVCVFNEIEDGRLAYIQYRAEYGGYLVDT